MKCMLLIYGNEEAFSSVGAKTFAEIARETLAWIHRGPLVVWQ